MTDDWFEALQKAMQSGQREALGPIEARIMAVVGDEPQNAVAWHALALIAHATGRLTIAEQRVNQALLLVPNHGEFLNTRGALRLAMNRAQDAEKDFEQAMKVAPQYPAAPLNLGRLRLGAHEAERAIEPLQQVIRLQPGNLEAVFLLASAYIQSGRLSQAEPLLKKLLQHPSVQAEAEAELGHIELLRGRVDTAFAHFEKAWSGKTSLSNRLSLCQFFVITGRVDRSIQACLEILKQDPANARALSLLGHNLAEDLSAEHQAALEQILRDEKRPAADRASAGYALAAVHDARKDHARAGDCAALANAQQRTLQPYDPQAHHRMISRIIGGYNADYFRRVEGWGSPERRPIFIVGMPRSGTTLVEQILAAHPQVFPGGELIFILGDMRTRSRAMGKDWTLLCQDFTRDDAARSAAGFLNVLRERNATARHVTDKLPENYFYLGWIRTLFPHAVILHCRRDDRDIALSCWMNRLYRLEWANDMHHIAQRLKEYHRLMDHWQRVLPNPPLEVHYESLVSDLEPEARRILSHCELEWDPACLEPHRVKRAVNTASTRQVRGPVHTGSIQKWRHYARHLEPVLAQAG